MRNYASIGTLMFFLFLSCEQKEGKPLPDFFNPDLNISVEDLKALDFFFVEDWSMYNFVTDTLSQTTAHMYQCLYDKNPVLN